MHQKRPRRGRHPIPPEDRKIGSSVTLHPHTWKLIDQHRGAASRSAFLEMAAMAYMKGHHDDG